MCACMYVCMCTVYMNQYTSIRHVNIKSVICTLMHTYTQNMYAVACHDYTQDNETPRPCDTPGVGPPENRIWYRSVSTCVLCVCMLHNV